MVFSLCFLSHIVNTLVTPGIEARAEQRHQPGLLEAVVIGPLPLVFELGLVLAARSWRCRGNSTPASRQASMIGRSWYGSARLTTRLGLHLADQVDHRRHFLGIDRVGRDVAPGALLHARGDRVALATWCGWRGGCRRRSPAFIAILWTQTELTPPAPITRTVDMITPRILAACADWRRMANATSRGANVSRKPPVEPIDARPARACCAPPRRSPRSCRRPRCCRSRSAACGCGPRRRTCSRSARSRSAAAWHRLTDLTTEERARGVVGVSSGNHAQGVAWAARRLGIAATIVMPHNAPQVKLDSDPRARRRGGALRPPARGPRRGRRPAGARSAARCWSTPSAIRG